MESTIFKLAQEWVPKGCTLTLKKILATKYLCELSMGNQKVDVNLHKLVAPEMVESYIKREIAHGMSAIYFEWDEWEKVNFWQIRMYDDTVWKKGDLEP